MKAMEDLSNTISDDNINGVKAAIINGASVNLTYRDDACTTPLIHATFEGRIKIVAY